MDHESLTAYPGGLSEFAGRSFDSIEEATNTLLRLLSERLGIALNQLPSITDRDR